MPDRLTVVFDNPEVYRRLKLLSASEGVPMKRLVEQALLDLLDARGRTDAEPSVPVAAKVLDWDRWDAAAAEFEALSIEDGEGPTNLSDIKHQLYSYPARALTAEGWKSVAEEPSQYDES
jgi:hypothetical protein